MKICVVYRIHFKVSWLCLTPTDVILLNVVKILKVIMEYYKNDST